MAGQITHIQELIESMLIAEPYFEDISVIRLDRGDIENIIDIAVAKIGICVLIMTPKMTVKNDDTPGPFFEIQATCEIVENVIVNRAATGTGKAASEVAEMVAATVHLKPAPGDNVLACQSVELTGVGKSGDRQQTTITYAADFKTYGGLALDVNPTATPVITDTTGTISMTCATAGASIFYTTNGKNPGPQSGTLYTGPFSVSSGTRIRVRAWIWGYTVSAEATHTA